MTWNDMKALSVERDVAKFALFLTSICDFDKLFALRNQLVFSGKDAISTRVSIKELDVSFRIVSPMPFIFPMFALSVFLAPNPHFAHLMLPHRLGNNKTQSERMYI